VPFDADVIVAGAGPAGAVAARTLAAAGIDTLLVDRAHFPRNKPCGGGLSARALRRFSWLAEALGGIDVHTVTTLHFMSPDGTAVDMRSRDPLGVLVRRVAFDHALVRAATRAGARLAERFEITQAETNDERVTLKSRDGRLLTARLVVAADGVHSVIAKRIGVNARWPPRAMAIDMMEETPSETLCATRPDAVWIAYAYNGLDGYAYVFPKVGHVNVGIGCLLSHFQGQVPERPYELHAGFVASAVESGVLAGRSDRRNFTPYLIPLGGPLPHAHRGRVLFAGDAGGFVNAITAEGIHYAMISGELAGRAVAAVGVAARAGDAGRAYDRLWRREIGLELRESVFIQRYLFANHQRINRFARASARVPWVASMLLDYTQGAVSYAALRRRVALRFPMTAVRLARELFSARLGRAQLQE
jgi:geranylgeranyl reductase family protein